jgi:hypothetical protein
MFIINRKEHIRSPITRGGEKMSLYNSFIKNVEKKSGLTFSEIKSKDPSEIREHFEKRFNSKTIFSSEFPFIGRGNVLRDGIINHDQLNKEIDKILKIS